MISFDGNKVRIDNPKLFEDAEANSFKLKNRKYDGKSFEFAETMSSEWAEVKQGLVLPICPYGCGEPGQLKGIVKKEDGTDVGIFHDSDGCEFQAPIKLRDNPSAKKIMKDSEGNLYETNS
jgi:hypothetical protein